MRHEAGGMTFIEFIGLIVTVILVIYVFLKQFFEDMKKKRNPEAYARHQREQERAIREMLGQPEEEDEDEEEDKYIPIVKKAPPPRPAAVLPVEQHRPSKPRAVTPTYEVVRKKQTSRGASLIHKLTSRKDLFIINEIMKPPVSQRSGEDQLW